MDGITQHKQTMSSTNQQGASDYISAILSGVTMAHMHHFTTKSYAQHMALGELYCALQDKVDALAEAWTGCSGLVPVFSGGKYSVGPDPIADVNALYRFVESNRDRMGSETHIQNIIDEICSTISTAIYKLERLS